MLTDLVELNERSTHDKKQETCFFINQHHAIFKGHFPEKPIMPGVVLINLFKKEAEVFFQQKFQLVQVKNAKFLKLIEPQKKVLLSLESSFTKDENFIKLTGKAFFEKELSTKLILILKKV